MPLQRNNAFKPLPTSDSLPTFPSNKPRNSKLTLKVLLARGIHVAGTTVQGELEISVKDKALALGEVGLELSGTEGKSVRVISSEGACGPTRRSQKDREDVKEGPGRERVAVPAS